MRILFLNQFFWPDTAATGQLLYDVAEHLSLSGDIVDVICGSANYGGTNSAPCPGVGVTRLPTAAYSPGIVSRLGSYFSFIAGSLWHGVSQPAPDIVVTLTTPPLLSLVGMAIQHLRGARHIIWEMDVYPDIAVELGVLKRNGLPARVFGWLADMPRRRADRVIALGECMRSRLLTHGIAEERIHVAENWADRDVVPGDDRGAPSHRSAELSIVYSGNFGRAHDGETIAGAMAELRSPKDGFRFVFGGGGSLQAWMRDFCKKRGVANVQFLPYCERAELMARLTACDIGLVTQHVDSAGAVVPSKSYGIMAAGRPVLFIGPRHSTTAQMIARHGCGWQIECNDVSGLVKLLRHLGEHRELVHAAGRRAYLTFAEHYQRSVGVARFAAALRAGVSRKPASVARTVSQGRQPNAAAGGRVARTGGS